MTSTRVDRVTATDSALVLLASLREEYGPLMFFQSGGCGEGSLLLCYPLGEFCVGIADVYLGNLDGTPFYMGQDQVEYWKHKQLIIDVADGMGGVSALDNSAERHFLTRSRMFTDEESELLEQAVLTAPQHETNRS